MKASLLPLAGILLAAGLGVAACGPQSSASSSTTSATPSPSASGSSSSASSSGSTDSSSESSAGYSDALTAWKAAASDPIASMNTDLTKAASDLKEAGKPSYGNAIDELGYLAGLPASNLSDSQISQAKSDEQNLDTFFGTPGLMISSGGSSSSGSTGSTGNSGSSSNSSAGYTDALTAWKAAASDPEASMNTDLQKAASDLKEAGNSSYGNAIDELDYLANLPVDGLSDSQQAQAKSDEQDLDKFFGTPGLMTS